MMADNKQLPNLLRELMRREARLPSQMAADIGVNHTTVSRWLSGKSRPSIKSLTKLAEYASLPLTKILSVAGHLPELRSEPGDILPEFREYASLKYPEELDEDVIAMFEDLIERRRRRKRRAKT